MNGTSKCGGCANKDKCHIRSCLNDIIRKAIQNAEDEVKRLSPSEIDYMIMTDISVIPTRCNDFISTDGIKEEHSQRERKFFLTNDLGSSVI